MIEKESREIIEANLDIISAFSDEGNGRRYWEVKGFSRVPCGGTHLKKKGEVGEIKYEAQQYWEREGKNRNLCK
jgi:Ser-tRNA(Ala) deacylase AlaX